MLRCVVAGRLMKDLTSDRNAVAAETAHFLIPVRCPRMAFREAGLHVEAQLCNCGREAAYRQALRNRRAQACRSPRGKSLRADSLPC